MTLTPRLRGQSLRYPYVYVNRVDQLYNQRSVFPTFVYVKRMFTLSVFTLSEFHCIMNNFIRLTGGLLPLLKSEILTQPPSQGAQ